MTLTIALVDGLWRVSRRDSAHALFAHREKGAAVDSAFAIADASRPCTIFIHDEAGRIEACWRYAMPPSIAGSVVPPD